MGPRNKWQKNTMGNWGDFTLLIGVVTLFISGRDPPSTFVSKRSNHVWANYLYFGSLLNTASQWIVDSGSYM